MKSLEQDIILSNKIKMPILGFGTYRITNEKECIESIKIAIKNKIRLIDTADMYRNHKYIAKALKELKINRKEIFITSKVWEHEYPISKENVLKYINRILKELELEYIDLILVHSPFASSLMLWEALEEAYNNKKIRAIGVSNFTVKQLEDFNKRVKIKPMVNQIQLHPYLPREDVVKYCQKNNITITSWQTIDEGKLLNDKNIVSLAKKYNATPAQICFKWAIQNNIAIIPKSVHENRILENINLDHFKISNEDMSFLNNLKSKKIPRVAPSKFCKKEIIYDELTWLNQN